MAEDQTNRRLAAVPASVVGYSRIMGADEAGASRALLGHLGEIEEARRVWAELKKINPRYSFSERMARSPFRDPADAAKIAAGLAKAGLPN
jgi:hypothetical protein